MFDYISKVITLANSIPEYLKNNISKQFVSNVKQSCVLCLMLMYIVFAIWWFIFPFDAVNIFFQNVSIYYDKPQEARLVRFLIRFSSVYFFFIVLVLSESLL